MQTRNNKTSICSIVFLDIIDYSKKTDSEQIEEKNKFNQLINQAIKGVAEANCIIIDTGDGAAICCDGSPEDILFISLTIRDEVIRKNIHSTAPLYLRFGINLGPVRVVKDINGRPNIIGDGINVAQRVMSFSEPNEILVSRSYYEVTARLTQEISQMFEYSGTKQDKHVREHEVYSVRSPKRLTTESFYSEEPEQTPPTALVTSNQAIYWKYAIFALIAFYVIIKLVNDPVQQTIASEDGVARSQNVDKNAEQVQQKKSTQRQSQTKQAQKNKQAQESKQESAASNTDEKGTSQKKSSWASFKESLNQGSESKCTQAEISMNQCN